MCFSKEAVLFSLIFLICHLFFYGVVYDSSKSKFGSLIRPYILSYTISWVAMEFFDYGLWNASIQNRCYDLISVSGSITVTGTAWSLIAMLLQNRKSGGLNDWDTKAFFLSNVMGAAILLLQNEMNDSFLPFAPIPKEPYRGTRPGLLNIFENESVTRNVWMSDNKWLTVMLLPPYFAPVVRGAWDNWFIPQKRFGRCIAHCLLLCIVGIIGSFITNLVSWGSVWCFVTGFNLLIFDLHIYLSHKEKNDTIIYPFRFISKKGE